MDAIERLYVDKPSRTFADELVTFGVMRLLAAIYQANNITYRITQRHCGSYDELTLEPAQTPALLDQVGVVAPIPFIKTLKNAADIPSDAPYADYEEQKGIRTQYFEALKRAKTDSHLLEGITPPHPHWDIFRATNPAALPGYTSLLKNWWQIQGQLPEVLTLLIHLFSQYPNPIAEAEAEWKALNQRYNWGIKPEATCQQLFNPDQGKGQNKPKADGLSIGNMENFWVLEYLKAVGFYSAAMTRTVKGGKDRKTFVIVPRDLDYSVHNTLMNDFRASMHAAESSIRFDILASLRYTRALIAHYLTPQASKPWLRTIYRPAQEVAGFRTAFYKDLGNAVATLNLAFVALPAWVRIESEADAQDYSRWLADQPAQGDFSFVAFVRQFDEDKNSDAFRLVQALRDFVSGGNLDAFFRFTSAFAGYYMGMRERNKYAIALQPAFIDQLMKGNEDMKLQTIIASNGFQAVAYAIRQSTVIAQYRKKQGDRKYDVRYGLAQELLRKARYADDFMMALSEFIAKYNAENAQVMETRPGPYRRSVQTSDLDAIAQLIDEHGSELVGNMLVAYGYARNPHKDEDPVSQDEETEDENHD
jgi:hypothetical protein